MRFAAVLLPVALGCHAIVATAGGLMVVDDAGVANPHSCQLELGGAALEHEQRYSILPACNFSQNLEWTAGMTGFAHPGGTDEADFVVQGKTVLKPLDGWGAALAIRVLHQAHDRGLGGYAYAPVTIPLFDDKFLLHANLGVFQLADGGITRMLWGLGSETKLSDRISLLAEVYARDDANPSIQAGIRLTPIMDRLSMDLTYSDTLDGKGAHALNLGLQFYLPSF